MEHIFLCNSLFFLQIANVATYVMFDFQLFPNDLQHTNIYNLMKQMHPSRNIEKIHQTLKQAHCDILSIRHCIAFKQITVYIKSPLHSLL